MKKLLNIILILLAGVVIFCVVMIVGKLSDYKHGTEEYGEADELVAEQLNELGKLEAQAPAADEGEEDLLIYPYARTIAKMDIDSLIAENDDVFGWIYIPGADISYPLVQAQDNYLYLSYTYKMSKNAVGAIFMDYRCDNSMIGYNSIIYGHRMNNGSMFAPLKKYLEQDFADECPYVYINSFGNVYQYTVFAAYEGDARGVSYLVDFEAEADRADFLASALDLSVITGSYEPKAADNILTLSTCTGNGYTKRMIVQAALTGILPSEASEAHGSAE